MQPLPALGRALVRLGSRLTPPLPEEYANDEFDWRHYNDEYRRELQRLDGAMTTRLKAGDVESSADGLVLRQGVPPLHPNHRLLYETIMLLQPDDVVEAGCGGGDHLHNLQLLLPSARICGFDRSSRQLDLLRTRNEAVSAIVVEADLTLPLPAAVPSADVVFTQAVLMHVRTGNGHRVGLANLFALARRQVVLMENWRRHDFYSDIRDLHERGVIRWPEVRLYFRRAPELADRPHLLIASQEELPFEELVDYAVLANSLDVKA